MNNFDKIFFSKYIPENAQIKAIIHQHIITILGKIFFDYFFLVTIPTFLYYYSQTLQSHIPFFVLEIFLIWIFFKAIYSIFNWYADVWIVTDEWVISFKWEIFWVNSNSVKYWNIEWLEIKQEWIFDSILWKWDLIIHKIWSDDGFEIKNASVPYDAINEIEKYSNNHKAHDDHHEDEEDENHGENYEIIVKALSWVIEDYLVKTWYKKENKKENLEYIKKVKKLKGTIDLNGDLYEDDVHDEHWHDSHWHDDGHWHWWKKHSKWHDEHWHGKKHDSHWHDDHWKNTHWNHDKHSDDHWHDEHSSWHDSHGHDDHGHDSHSKNDHSHGHH